LYNNLNTNLDFKEESKGKVNSNIVIQIAKDMVKNVLLGIKNCPLQNFDLKLL